MKKIRTMLAFILALSICASMAACGSSGDSGVKSESKSVTTDEKADDTATSTEADETAETSKAEETEQSATEPSEEDEENEKRYGYYELLKNELAEYGDTTFYNVSGNGTTMMKDGKGVFVLEPKDPFDTIKLISFDAEGNFNVLFGDPYSRIVMRSGYIYIVMKNFEGPNEIRRINICDGTTDSYLDEDNTILNGSIEDMCVSANGDVIVHNRNNQGLDGMYKLDKDFKNVSGGIMQLDIADSTEHIAVEDTSLSTMSYGDKIYLSNGNYYLDCNTMQLVTLDTPVALDGFDIGIHCIGKYAFIYDSTFYSEQVYDMEKDEYVEGVFPTRRDVEDIWRVNVGDICFEALDGYGSITSFYGGGDSHILTDSEGVWHRIKLPAVTLKDTEDLSYVDDCVIETLGKESYVRGCVVIDDDHYLFFDDSKVALRSFEKGDSEDIDVIER